MSEAPDIRTAAQMSEGAGARVRRLFPVAGGYRNYDPFVLWDHFTVGPDAGFPPHPHRGFEAITYLFDGAMQHEDNLGNRSTVTGGGAQRFTAGRGLVHSEMPGDAGDTIGIQLWINLPQRLKTVEPDYQQVDADSIPEHRFAGGVVREIVGPASPLRLLTPVRYLEIRFDSNGQWSTEVDGKERGLLYMVAGDAEVDGARVNAGQALFVDGPAPLAVAGRGGARAMLVLGQPHGEPIRQYGPYVD